MDLERVRLREGHKSRKQRDSEIVSCKVMFSARQQMALWELWWQGDETE